MPKSKTEQLPGVEGEGVSPAQDKELDKLITKWRNITEQRMALTVKESEAKTAVYQMMHDKGLTDYLYEAADDDYREVVLIETVKYRRPKKTDDGEEGEEE